MSKTITIRAVGRDFTGPADTLEAWDRAKAFAQGYMWGVAGTEYETKEVVLFQVDELERGTAALFLR
jgi:hypothetical protein